MKLDVRQALRCAAVLLAAATLAACASPSGVADENTAQADKALAAFPTALDGYQRYVINLPPQTNENERKLELMGGKEMTVDCNARGLDGHFMRRDVKGWGYSYWVLESHGQGFSTKMACPPGTEHPGFVPVPPLVVRYNSKLPVVVFAPEGMALRYRIWRAGAVEQASVR